MKKTPYYVQLTLSLLSNYFCHLLLTISNSSDLDEDQQNFGPDLDLNPLTI